MRGSHRLRLMSLSAQKPVVNKLISECNQKAVAHRRNVQDPLSDDKADVEEEIGGRDERQHKHRQGYHSQILTTATTTSIRPTATTLSAAATPAATTAAAAPTVGPTVSNRRL